ncbi:MAG: alpha/beta hydrolase [Kangiellaceae bacterium]|nr:alpha/beta hydrolase [Kangiellaceae bacterium]
MWLFVLLKFLRILAGLLTISLIVVGCRSDKVISDTIPTVLTPYFSQSIEHDVRVPFFNSSVHITEMGQDNATTLLLVHGLGANAAGDWALLVSELSKKYHLVALDLPGFGKSEHSNEILYTPENYSKLLHWVRQRYAKSLTIVVGHSMGAAISLKYASEYPDDIQRLVMIDAAGILQESVFIKYIAQLSSNKSTQNPFKKVWNNVLKKVDSITEAIIHKGDEFVALKSLVLNNPQVRKFLVGDYSMANAATGLVIEDFSRAIRSFDKPVLIVWGEDDPVAPIRTANVLHHNLPYSKLQVIANTQHVPMKERPRDTLFILQQWLDSSPQELTIQDPRLAKDLEVFSSQRRIDCKDTENKHFSGDYHSISIVNCKNIRLTDVRAQTILIENSSVLLDKVEVRQGINVRLSKIKATAMNVFGATPLTAESSTLDIAGSNFVASQLAMTFVGENLLYWSVSSYKKGSDAVQYLHGRKVEVDTSY